MKLFISYARVDKPYCVQIAEMLDIHDVWYDQRLYAGQNWWKAILRRLDWCDGFVYLLSPDSVASQYCREEYMIAMRLNKTILPVLIDSNTRIPEPIKNIHYADLSNGLTVNATKTLLNALYRIERDTNQNKSIPLSALETSEIAPPVSSPTTIIGRAAEAMDQSKFDQAVFLLRQAREKGFRSKYWDIDALLAQAEIALENQAKEKETRLEYQTIKELINRKLTRQTGCQALRSFLREHPTYDPENLSRICGGSEVNQEQLVRIVPEPAKPPALPVPTTTLPVSIPVPVPPQSALPPGKPVDDLSLLEFIDIPAGTSHGVHVATFSIAKYPVTNEQYERFLKDANGYRNSRWWDFSTFAQDWFRRNPRPRASRFKGDTLPRESICWYEAMAFCGWLGDRMDCPVILPTGAQWRRAASGDDDRAYPWGDNFDPAKCNTRESKMRQTTSVIRYPDGSSPFGATDMAGNVWEWCLDSSPEEAHQDMTLNLQRTVLGGSFLTASERARATFNFYLDPEYYYGTIGFRVAISG